METDSSGPQLENSPHWGDRLNPLAPIRRLAHTDEPQFLTPPAHTSTVPPTIPRSPPLRVDGQVVQYWQDGYGRGCLLRGDCEVVQDTASIRSRELVLWQRAAVSTPGELVEVFAYFEGDVEISDGVRTDRRQSLFVDLTAAPFEITADYSTQLTAPPIDPIYERAVARRREQTGIQTVQGEVLDPGPQLRTPGPSPGSAPPFEAPGNSTTVRPNRVPRHVKIYPRAMGETYTMQTEVDENSAPREYVTTITGGVRLVVDGVPMEIDGRWQLITIDLAADRAIIWTDADRINELSTDFDLDGQSPFEVYLEGDIEVRQGTSVVHAERAFYDLNEERGLLMNSELRTYIPELGATVRLRARQIRQLSHDRFIANDAWFSTSEMGVPGYRIQSRQATIDRRAVPGYSTVNPQTGEVENGLLWFTGVGNRLFIENVPVAAIPRISSPAEDPNIPLKNIGFGWDKIFGFQGRSTWDAAQIFGIDAPGLDWDVGLDYYEKRGPGIGTDIGHTGVIHAFGMPIQSVTSADVYYVHDDGRDNLGLGRRDLTIATENRGKAIARNRLDFGAPWGLWMNNELGYLSDRNFQEQYFERDWDTAKDVETLSQLNWQADNFTASIMARQHLFEFENTTDWLPRVDATLLAQQIGNTPLLWSQHSMVGYGQLFPAQAPPPDDTFSPLPYVADRNGLVAMSRHELDLPLTLGPVNLTPYALGEVAYWQQDLSGDELTRLYGSLGVRGSLMFSKYMPQVYSEIFGLNGLAHKMVFDADYSYSESTEPLSKIAQYNEFDEDAQERFRERFLTLSYGGVLPATFEPRFYAVRAGAARSVTAPYHELVDDQQVVRLGWRHRLQTRVGPPQAPRIYDWMTLDLEASLFPNADRDNFGETFGLLTARYAWNVGPSTSFLASSTFDLFDPGQQIWDVGVLTSRAGRGSLYVGVRGLEAGPIGSALFVASATYQPSDKWAFTLGTQYDIVENLDRGQSASITRLGEYLIFSAGIGVDVSRDNYSIAFSVEPRFGNLRTRRGSTRQLDQLLGGTR